MPLESLTSYTDLQHIASTGRAHAPLPCSSRVNKQTAGRQQTAPKVECYYSPAQLRPHSSSRQKSSAGLHPPSFPAQRLFSQPCAPHWASMRLLSTLLLTVRWFRVFLLYSSMQVYTIPSSSCLPGITFKLLGQAHKLPEGTCPRRDKHQSYSCALHPLDKGTDRDAVSQRPCSKVPCRHSCCSRKQPSALHCTSNAGMCMLA